MTKRRHLEEIRQMRRDRKMWAEIAAHLKEAHGLEVSYRTIRNFFIRTRSPNRRIPAGFEESLGAQPVPHSSVLTSSAVTMLSSSTGGALPCRQAFSVLWPPASTNPLRCMGF